MNKSKWEYKKLGEVCTFINGLWVGKKPPYKEVGVIRNANFTKECQLRTDNIAVIEVEEKQFDKKKLKKGDIIIEKSGGSDKQPVGRPVLFNLDGEYSFSNFTSALRIKEVVKLNPKFLHKCLASYYFAGATKAMQSKTTGLHNLDLKMYKNQLIPIIPISIQQSIVSELDQLSAIISLKQQQMKEYDALAQSLFYEMFGDPFNNNKERLNRFLNKICLITSSKRIFANEYVKKGVPFYRGKEITELSKGESVSEPLFISEERYEEIKSQYGIPRIGDILVTAVGTIGNIWVVNNNKPFYFKDGNIIWLHPKENFDATFFRMLLTIIIDKFKDSLSNGAAYKALTIQNLGKVKVSLPPLSLQRSFAEKVKAIEHQKSLLKQSIAETQTLLDSRMQEYFG